MIETILENWKGFGGTAIVTAIITYIAKPNTKRANEKKAEEEADGQGLQNINKVLEINAREIERIEQRFKDQLVPLHQIIATQKEIIETQKIELRKVMIENEKYFKKFGKL